MKETAVQFLFTFLLFWGIAWAALAGVRTVLQLLHDMFGEEPGLGLVSGLFAALLALVQLV
jgi:hypothetical protein